MRIVIVTGASQGLGEALVRNLLGHEDTWIVAISRTENKNLMAEAKNRLEWVPYDLAQTDGLEQLMERILADAGTEWGCDVKSLQAAYLINNAGMVQPIAPAERCGAEEIARNVQLNLVAPMILTSAFVRHLASCPGDKAVLNISSGAGRHPYEGWSSYCSSKAGLDMFTRCVGLEQQGQSNPVRVLSIAPGVVDTPMQQVIRSTNPSDFSQHARFVELKQSGSLQTPESVASKLLQVMTDARYTTGSLLDVRTLEH